MRAKLFGFIERPDTLARRYPMSDTSLPRVTRAIPPTVIPIRARRWRRSTR